MSNARCSVRRRRAGTTSLGAGRHVDGLARRPVGAGRAARAGARPGLFRRRSHARDAVGERWAAPGNPASALRSGGAPPLGLPDLPPPKPSRSHASAAAARHHGAGEASGQAGSCVAVEIQIEQHEEQWQDQQTQKTLSDPRLPRYRANCSFNHVTIMVAISSAGWPGVRPM